MSRRILPYGPNALLVEVGDPDGPVDSAAVLRVAAAAAQLPGVTETVPAARTVLVVCDEPARTEAALDRLDTSEAAHSIEHGLPAEHGGAELVELPVRYDGADLADVASEVGMTPDELIRCHSAAEYVVAFCGFAPGFAYLTGLDAQLHLPRLPEPRTRVPAGSVGIAGEFTGVYPRSSPGGWRLLGRADARLWDAGRTPPALLAPGTRVRFRPA